MATENSLLLGATETLTSPSFITRKDAKLLLNKSIKRNKECGHDISYEWAEYKTSLLMVSLYNNNTSNFDLKLFMQKMIINIISILRLDLHTELNLYMNELKTAKQKDITRSYPVAQSQIWLNNENISGLWDDVYGLINFAKWLWANIHGGKYYNSQMCDEASLNYYIILELFQQKIFAIQTVLRGSRYNDPTDKPEDKTPYVGISQMEKPILKRNVKSIPNAKIEPWIHPGTKQCFVPYSGGYGQMIKSYRDSPDHNINIYSSLQCGLSGSVNYFLFLYLLSTIISDDKTPLLSLQRLILIISMQLAGDGGHNLREITFGITTAVIVVHHMINDVKAELANNYKQNLTFREYVNLFIQDPNTVWATSTLVLGNMIKQFLYKGISTHLDKCLNISQTEASKELIRKRLFITVLNALVNWETSITYLYNMTAHINIVGFNKQYIESKNITIDQQTFNECKKAVYDLFFGIKKLGINQKTGIVTDIVQSNKIQLFFALENDRYLKSTDISFKTAADELTNSILKMYPGTLDQINSQVRNDLRKCYPNSADNQRNVPFA
jgi:hypothetical protein